MLGSPSHDPIVEQRMTGTITEDPYLITAAGPAGPPDKEQWLFMHCGVCAQRG